MSYSVLPDITQELLEKPVDDQDNLRMLLDMNGGVCEVVTGVTLGNISTNLHNYFADTFIVYPILAAPGYEIKCAQPTLTYQYSFVADP